MGQLLSCCGGVATAVATCASVGVAQAIIIYNVGLRVSLRYRAPGFRRHWQLLGQFDQGDNPVICKLHNYNHYMQYRSLANPSPGFSSTIALVAKF